MAMQEEFVVVVELVDLTCFMRIVFRLVNGNWWQDCLMENKMYHSVILKKYKHLRQKVRQNIHKYVPKKYHKHIQYLINKKIL